MDRPATEPGHTRLADEIVAAIEARIASGALPDHAPLPAERALMEEFGSSRTVVREAITALANRGLIETRPRHRPVVRRAGFKTALDASGPVVRRLLAAPGGVRNLFEARIFVERGLVREAALRAGAEHIRALRTALQANGAAIDNSAEFYTTDIDFHRTLYAVPDNPVFTAIHDGFVAWLAPLWQIMGHDAGRNAQNHRAHQAIFAAILERDPDAAEAALADHLAMAWEDLGEIAERAGPPAG